MACPVAWRRVVRPASSSSHRPASSSPRNRRRGVDRQGGQVTHLGQRAHLDELASAQDRHPVAEGLHLAQDVRGQEHRLPPPARLGDTLAEGLLHQRIQTGGRLVENQQVSPRTERGDQKHLLPVALGVGPDPLGRIKLEPSGQLVPAARVDLPLDAAQQVQRLAPGQPRPQVRLRVSQRA